MADSFDALDQWTRDRIREFQKKNWDATMSDSRSSLYPGKVDLLWELRRELLGDDPPADRDIRNYGAARHPDCDPWQGANIA